MWHRNIIFVKRFSIKFRHLDHDKTDFFLTVFYWGTVKKYINHLSRCPRDTGYESSFCWTRHGRTECHSFSFCLFAFFFFFHLMSLSLTKGENGSQRCLIQSGHVSHPESTLLIYYMNHKNFPTSFKHNTNIYILNFL